MAHFMGMGKLGGPELVFIRQFRFLMEGEHLEAAFNKSADIDWTTKTIKLKAYEVICESKIAIHDWAFSLAQGKYPQETLTLITLDGCGQEMYKVRFYGLSCASLASAFDYSVSEATLFEVVVNYKKCKKLKVKKHKAIVDTPLFPDVKELKARESRIDHLNDTLFIA